MARIKLEFKDFWEAYGLKKNRLVAERAWNRLPDKDKRVALAGIRAYREECQRTGVAMCLGSNYLLNRRWEDEPDVAVKPAQMSAPSDAKELGDMDTW
jgi:hypothetical protein